MQALHSIEKKPFFSPTSRARWKYLFRVWGFGHTYMRSIGTSPVQGPGFRVSDVGFRVESPPGFVLPVAKHVELLCDGPHGVCLIPVMLHLAWVRFVL